MLKKHGEALGLKLDPYLFFLLKRMIEYEVSDSLVSIPTRESVINFIKASTKFEEQDRPTVAEYFRKYIWAPNRDKISVRELDWMVKLVTKMGDFGSWSLFTIRFSEYYQNELYNDPYYDWDEPEPIEEYESFDEEQSRLKVDSLLRRILNERTQEGLLSSTKSPILKSKEVFQQIARWPRVVKIAKHTKEDLRYFEFVDQKINSFPRSLSKLYSWFEQNNNIFYYLVEEMVGEMDACLTVLPLKSKCIEDLIKHKKCKSDIKQTDFYSDKQSSSVSYLFIESYLSYNISSYIFFSLVFEQIKQNLSSIPHDKIKIGAIACTSEIEDILLFNSFSKTKNSILINQESKASATLYETTLDDFFRLLKIRTTITNTSQINSDTYPNPRKF